MANKKFNLGDRVRVVTESFAGMHNLRGKIGTIIDIKGNLWDYGVQFDDFIDGHDCSRKGKMGHCRWGYESELERVTDLSKIVIIVDGNKTIARMYDGNKVIKEAFATCSPEDKFDFETGAKLAFERLELKSKEDEKVEAKVEKTHKFKTGDRAIITECLAGHKFPIGTIVTIDSVSDGDYFAKDSNGKTWWVVDEELAPLTFKPGDKVKIIANECCHSRDIGSIVTISHEMRGLSCKGYVRYGVEGGGTWVTDHDIEPYTEPEAPKSEYYNGKVVCVKSNGDFTIGKVYEIVDGKLTDNDGSKRPYPCEPERGIKSLEDPWLNGGFPYKFIPYVEDAPKSKYYNGKVVCVDNKCNEDSYTVGKVYQFVDGYLTGDNGNKYPLDYYEGVESFDEWKDWSGAKWIEFKE